VPCSPLFSVDDLRVNQAAIAFVRRAQEFFWSACERDVGALSADPTERN